MLNVVEKRSLGIEGYRTARDVIGFVENCLHFTNGKNMVLFPWQKKWILQVFKEHLVVIEDDETGERYSEIRRVVSNSLVSMPRKNGKTGLMSAIAAAFAFGPLYERGMEIACAATTKDQAKILFNETKKMMKASPVFVEDGTFEFYATSIFSEHHGVKFQPVASREAGLHGLNCNVVLLDEVARMPDLKVYHTLNEAVSTRPNSMVISFSTMDDRVNNPMIELIGSVRAREFAAIETDSWHVLEHKADLDDDPDPLSDNNMRTANPSLPYLPELLVTLEEERKVAATSDYALGRWITTRLNIPGASDTQFLDPLKWAKCASPVGREQLSQYPIDEPVRLGVDLSRSRDLSAIGMWFPERRFLDCMAFLPAKEIAAMETRHKLPFRKWVDDGHLIACDGAVVDYDVIADFLSKLAQRFDVMKMRYDAWGYENLRDALVRSGAEMPAEGVRMGSFTMDPYLIKFENLVEAKELTHSNTPILNYCIASTAVEQDKRSITGVRKPVKAYHNSLIDCTVASMLAVGASPKDDGLSLDQIVMDFDD